MHIVKNLANHLLVSVRSTRDANRGEDRGKHVYRENNGSSKNQQFPEELSVIFTLEHFNTPASLLAL